MDASDIEGENVQVRRLSSNERACREERLDLWRLAWRRDQPYLDELRRLSPDLADREIRRREREREQIEAEPACIDQVITASEIGAQSIAPGNFSYDPSSGARRDPVNVIFTGRYGSLGDVVWTMTQSDNRDYYMSRRWTHYNSASQYVWFYDRRHVGGWNGTQLSGESLRPRDDDCYDWFIRDREACYHVRLYQSLVRNDHGHGGYFWTVGTAHHDNEGHSCVDDWERAEYEVTRPFRDSHGVKAWFVSGIWTRNMYNEGNFQCAYNDGSASHISIAR